MSRQEITYKSVRPSSIVIPDSNKETSSNDSLTWNNDQILLWLKNKNYSDEIIDMFKTHNITGMVLPYLNTKELKDMGIQSLKLRLALMKDINNLLLEKSLNLLSFGNDPITNDLQSLVLTTNLISSISNSITEGLISSSTGYQRKLTDQFNKLKEDLLPILKEIKDKKPLPTPDFQSITNSAIPSPYNPQSPLSTNSSPIKLNSHQAQLQSTIKAQSIPNSTSSKKIHPASSTSNYRKSITSPPIISPISHDSNQPSLSTSSSSGNIPQSGTGLNQTLSSAPHLRSPMKPSMPLSNSTTSFKQAKPKMSLSSSSSTIPMLSQQSTSATTPTANNASNNSTSEPLKQLRAKTEDPCHKILQAAMKRHNLLPSDWKKYVLVICYGGDQERVLSYDEKPVLVFRELADMGLNPSIMLRQVEDGDIGGNGNGLEGDGGWSTPGGRL